MLKGKGWYIAVGLMALANLSFGTRVVRVCKGFLPPNDLKIPVSIMQKGGLTEVQFNKVLDQIQTVYAPIVAARGGQLTINREWDDPTVNASADEEGNVWDLNMYGGLARDPSITPDGFMLVACHEMGHHLGGAPKFTGWFGQTDWASVEGQADYFATLRCLRNMFNDQDNQQFVANNKIDPFLQEQCVQQWNNQADENLCMREGMAAASVTALFQSLDHDKTPPAFNTPDTTKVSSTMSDHPGTQCRLDTYFEGSLCPGDMSKPLSDTDPNVGACTQHNGDKIGLRPACWFAEDASVPAPGLAQLF